MRPWYWLRKSDWGNLAWTAYALLILVALGLQAVKWLVGLVKAGG